MNLKDVKDQQKLRLTLIILEDNLSLDQVIFVGAQLIIRSILKYFLYEFHKTLLNTAALPRNLLDPYPLY